MRSLYIKNFMSSALLVIVSFIITGSAFIFLGKSFIVSAHKENMENNAEVIVKVASAITTDGDLTDWNLRIAISSISSSSGNHIFITDEDGVVVSCSDVNVACDHLGTSVSFDVMYTLTTYSVYDETSTLGGFYEGLMYIHAIPITSASTGEVFGYVFVSTEVSTITSSWVSFLWVFLTVAVAVLMLAMLISLISSKRMVKPLNEMAVAARKFSYGDFTTRVSVDKNTYELAALTNAFNNMADSLCKAEQQRNEFIANVSHELKTPMTTISGFADGILDGTIPKELEGKYLATIADETRRLARLVRSMLDMSQMQSVGTDLTRRSEFDLNELIIRTLLNFEARATEKNLEVDLQLPDKHMKVIADPDGITQVLYNLLDNAIKFSTVDGVLVIALWKRDGKAYVSVKNRGETIPKDDLPLIFERFHKSDRSRSLDRDGVGLCLYLVKNILYSHNEDIAASSRDGLTEFVFTLTLVK